MTRSVPFGRLGYSFIIDESDWPRVSGYAWCIRRKPDRIYVYAVMNGKKISLHRFLLCVSDPLIYVDHANGNTLDNRRSNLRLCTNQQNRANAKLNVNSSSGYKGVSRCGNKWRATIQVNNRKVALGVHETPEIAHQAYLSAATQFFGQFSNGGLRES